MTSEVIYKGDLRTAATHLQSGTVIETDAPTDNNGKGERFSPSDLVATALASCMMTIMGIAARTHGFDIDGTTCSVQKIMVANPRRIGEIKIDMRFLEGKVYDDKTKAIIERAALTCPVFESLHPDCKKTVDFLWS
ncbi:MAG TPA: OsmC family protein [Chitinophagaceae bacterium]|nr:OsmC family protein [Chitinophagaceae bacterium]